MDFLAFAFIFHTIISLKVYWIRFFIWISPKRKFAECEIYRFWIYNTFLSSLVSIRSSVHHRFSRLLKIRMYLCCSYGLMGLCVANHWSEKLRIPIFPFYAWNEHIFISRWEKEREKIGYAWNRIKHRCIHRGTLARVATWAGLSIHPIFYLISSSRYAH